MRSEKEIREKLQDIESDQSFREPCATVIENAPLALIQNTMETWQNALRWVVATRDKDGVLRYYPQRSRKQKP
jgi:hypothetical protein